ncbi:SURF1 family protein [Melaminivora sp.]
MPVARVIDVVQAFSQRRGWRFGVISVAALFLILLTAWLGRWQLSRAEQKLALQAEIEQRASAPPLDQQQLAQALQAGRWADLLHRRVQLRGQWLAQATVFLDNRQMYGKPGFFMLTPLRLDAPGAPVLLVQRGWVQRNFLDRSLLPDIPTPAGPVLLQGRLAGPPSALLELASAPPGQAQNQPASMAGNPAENPQEHPAKRASRIRQNLDMPAFAAETGLALAPLSMLQTDAASEGLARDWPLVQQGVAKHYGYAFQWFGLSALVAFLYVWFQFVRPSPGPQR